MQPEMLRELQRRGRVFYEVFPGTKVSDDWQRQRDVLDERELARSSSSSATTANDTRSDP